MSVPTYQSETDKPYVPPYSPTEAQKRCVRQIEEKMRAAQQQRRVLDEVWIECVAVTIGKQWHRYNWNGGFLELPKAPSWVTRATHNLVKPKVAQVAAALVGDMPQLDVDPESNTEEDKLDARAGQDLLKYLQARLSWDTLFVSIGRWEAMCGMVYIKTLWDPSEMDMHAVPQFDPMTGQQAFEPVIDPETGQPAVDPITGVPVQGKPIIKGEPGRIGQVKTVFVSPFEVYRQPGIQSWDENEWLIHSKLRTLEYVRERYPEFGKYVQPEVPSFTNGAYVERRVSDILQGGSTVPPNENQSWCVVLEYWRKPCENYPRGQLQVACNGVLLRDDVLPYEHLIVRRELPFVPFIYEPFELRIEGQGMVESLVPLQREYNLIWSRFIASVLLSSWPKMIKHATTDLGQQSVTDQPGEIVTYRGDPTLKPEWWVPPPVPATVLESLDRIKADIDDIAYRHQVSSGSHVAGLSAGVSIQLEQEADNQSFGPIRTLFHAAIAKVGMHCLSLCRQFYDEDRLGYIIGEDDQPEIVAFNRERLPDYANVKPSTTAATPMSRAARQQMLLDLYKLGAFGPPGSPVANQILLERLEFGNVSEMIEQQQAQAVEQQRMQMMQQQVQGDQAMAQQDQKHGQAMEMADRGEAAQLQRDGQSQDASLLLNLTKNGMQKPPSAPRAGR